MTEKVRVRAVVHGRVQGVGFRWATAQEAERRGVAGFVRNLPEGTVEAQVEGDAEAVEAVLTFLRQGPPSARVSAVDVETVPVRGDDTFTATG